MPKVIKAVTWNVNSLRIRLAHVLEFLDTHKPDILCLQETKVEDGLFPREPFIERGYHLAFHGQKSYNGVAIASLQPLEDVATGFGHTDLPEPLALQTRLLAATTFGMRVISAYVTNGESPTSEKFALKEAFYANLNAYVEKELKSHPHLLLCGDFNVAFDERDIDQPEKSAKHVLFTPQERQWLTNLITRNNLTDAFRKLDQAANVYSWYDYRTYGRNPNTGARIDYHFASPALAPCITGFTHHQEERPKPQPSDHIPLTVEFSV